MLTRCMLTYTHTLMLYSAQHCPVMYIMGVTYYNNNCIAIELLPPAKSRITPKVLMQTLLHGVPIITYITTIIMSRKIKSDTRMVKSIIG